MDATPLKTDPGSQPRMIGRYQLIQPIASGGMGTVYLGGATAPGGFVRLVAVKSIHPHLAQERAFVDMFKDEACIAARIHHSNVGSVLDYGEERGQVFLVMDYIFGETLN